MRILAVHNAYQQHGGEDVVFAAETDLLRSAGHHVDVLHTSNSVINGVISQASAALFALYNPVSRRRMATALKHTRPDIVHVHNFFPRLSPSIFDACVDAQVPAVWTLHNYRIACANGLLFRDGVPCEDCLGGMPIPAVLHRCYRNSMAGSAAVAGMIGYHRLAGTWRTKIARFIVLSQFAAGKMEVAGIPRERISVKPNFVPDPKSAFMSAGPRHGVVFVGRLSAEKGVHTLIEAWREMDVPLTIIGDGPALPTLRAAAPANVQFAGHLSRDNVYAALAGAAAVVIPSVWYENCPMTVVEAMALGTPIIASRLGALSELVDDGFGGFHFTPGDPTDLGRVVRKALADPTALALAGHEARRIYTERFAPESSLKKLLFIYSEAIRSRASGTGTKLRQ